MNIKKTLSDPKVIFIICAGIVLTFFACNAYSAHKEKADYCQVFQKHYCEDSTDKSFCEVQTYNKCMVDFK